MDESLRITKEYQQKMSEMQALFAAERKKYEQKLQISDGVDKGYKE